MEKFLRFFGVICKKMSAATPCALPADNAKMELLILEIFNFQKTKNFAMLK